jgi:hypothetical protein
MPEYYKDMWNWIHAMGELPGLNMTHLVTKFHGQFNLEAWNRSIDLVIDRHPILKSRVAIGVDGPEFILESEFRNQLTVLAFSAPPDRDMQMALKEMASALIWEPFDPKEGRLFRAFMIVVSDVECVLGVVVHHFIADGWSIAIIGRELLIGYAASISRRQLPLPEPGTQYLDYIEWMSDWLKGPEAESQATYRARQMMNAPTTRLPVECNIDPDAKADVSIESFTIDRTIARHLYNRAREARTTPFLLLLGAKIAALSAVLGSSDIVVAIIAEGRGDLGLRNTVGLLVNNLPIRVAVDWGESFNQLSVRVRQTYLEACKNQLYPSDIYSPGSKLFPVFRFRRIISQNTLSEGRAIGFRFFELPSQPPIKTSARWMPYHYLEILHTGDSMSCNVGYLSTLYRRETITHFVQTFCNAVEMAACGSEKPLSILLGQ